MPVFSLDFYTIFSILYHFDTVLGGFMGSGGGGGGGCDSPHAHGSFEPGLGGFDTVLGGIFGLGGGGGTVGQF